MKADRYVSARWKASLCLCVCSSFGPALQLRAASVCPANQVERAAKQKSMASFSSASVDSFNADWRGGRRQKSKPIPPPSPISTFFFEKTKKVPQFMQMSVSGIQFKIQMKFLKFNLFQRQRPRCCQISKKRQPFSPSTIKWSQVAIKQATHSSAECQVAALIYMKLWGQWVCVAPKCWISWSRWHGANRTEMTQLTVHLGHELVGSLTFGLGKRIDLICSLNWSMK